MVFAESKQVLACNEELQCADSPSVDDVFGELIAQSDGLDAEIVGIEYLEVREVLVVVVKRGASVDARIKRIGIGVAFSPAVQVVLARIGVQEKCPYLF